MIFDKLSWFFIGLWAGQVLQALILILTERLAPNGVETKKPPPV